MYRPCWFVSQIENFHNFLFARSNFYQHSCSLKIWSFLASKRKMQARVFSSISHVTFTFLGSEKSDFKLWQSSPFWLSDFHKVFQKFTKTFNFSRQRPSPRLINIFPTIEPNMIGSDHGISRALPREAGLDRGDVESRAGIKVGHFTWGQIEQVTKQLYCYHNTL